MAIAVMWLRSSKFFSSSNACSTPSLLLMIDLLTLPFSPIYASMVTTPRVCRWLAAVATKSRLDMETTTAVVTSVGAPSPSSAHSSLTTLYVSPYKFVLQDGINFAHRSLSHGIFLRTCLRSRLMKSLAAKLPHRRAHTHGVFWA
jgi:hypothetical protein